MLSSTTSTTRLRALVEIERERRRRQRERPAGGVVSLASFVEEASAIRLEPWQRIICDRLQQLRTQTGQRLLIHGPPQFGKSIIISQRFPAWVLQQEPSVRVRVACYNVTHAERFSAVNLALSQQAGLVPPRASVKEWSTTARSALLDANPSFVPLGLGTGFTGLGADVLIIDDPYKNRQEARSEAVNAALRGWWADVVLPRLNPATNVVVMFHRWWEGDFAGYLIEQGGWELMRFPAIADGKGFDPTNRALGEVLSPRYDHAYLEHIRREQGESFYALYQGDPVPATGGMFRTGKVHIVPAVPADVVQWVRWWDKAATEQGGDYTAGVLLGRRASGRYLIADVRRGQWASDERDLMIRGTAVADRDSYGVVTTYGPQDPGQAGKVDAAAFVKLLAGFPVATQRESGDKLVRADPFASQWNAGNVDLLAGAWNADYLHELTTFPYGKHDDQVDASSGAFGVLTVPSDHKTYRRYAAASYG